MTQQHKRGGVLFPFGVTSRRCGSRPPSPGSPVPPLKRTAVHEASHVVWLFLRGGRIEKVSVEPNGKSEGRVTMPEGRQQFVDPPSVSAKPDPCTVAVTQAAVLLSGPAGVAVLTGSRALSDEPEILDARDILAEAYPRMTVGCTLNDIWRFLCDRLAYPPVWAGVEALARRLLQDRQIDYTTAHIIVHDAMVKAAEHQPTEYRRTA